MTYIQSQLKTLVQLAVVDGRFDESEEKMIKTIAEANNVPSEETQQIINAGMSSREKEESLDFTSLSFDEKFEHLYNIVQLMKIDREVYLSEIKFCERLAEKLGFDRKVVSKLSSNIFSDPSITADREKLKTEVKKYIN